VEKIHNSSLLWSKLIDLKKVEIVLKWLKKYNHLYSDINICINDNIVQSNQIFTENFGSQETITIVHNENF
jgi:hypothetical protein